MDEYNAQEEPVEEIDESTLANDEYIEEEVDVEDIANSNRTMINALIDLLIQKGVINEQVLLDRATSPELPDYGVDDEEDDDDDEEDDEEDDDEEDDDEEENTQS